MGDALTDIIFAFFGDGWRVAALLAVGALVFYALKQWPRFRRRWQSGSWGETAEAFPYATMQAAREVADQRRKAIETFLRTGEAPAIAKESYAAGSQSETYEEVVTSINLHARIGSDVRAGPEFIEAPPLLSDFLGEAGLPPIGTPPQTKAKLFVPPRLVLGTPNIVGQAVRLEAELKSERLIEDVNLSLLLGRVVDAAVLADAFLARRHELDPDKGQPFFERIYLEDISPGLIWHARRGFWRLLNSWPMAPVGRLFGVSTKLWGPLPACVVIETAYPDTFASVVLRNAGPKDALTKKVRAHFGIAIRIAKPSSKRDAKSKQPKLTWSDRAKLRWQRLVRALIGTDSAQDLAKPAGWTIAKPAMPCRAVRSMGKGKLNAPCTIVAGQRQTDLSVQIAPAGIIADTCKSRWLAAKAKGIISQAPPIFAIGRGVSEPMPDKFCQTANCAFGLAKPKYELTVDILDAGITPRKAKDQKWRLKAKWELGAWWDERSGSCVRFPAQLYKTRTGAIGGDRLDLAGCFITRGKAVEGLVISSSGPAAAPHLVVDAVYYAPFLAHLMLRLGAETEADTHTPATGDVAHSARH